RSGSGCDNNVRHDFALLLWSRTNSIANRSGGACRDVTARRRLDLRNLCMAEGRACWDLLTGLGSQPRLPIRPPPPRYFARGLQPALWLLAQLAVDPEIGLDARRRIDAATTR